MFRTDHFKEEQAFIQLEGFDFSKTDESLFRQSDRMKNINQLTHDLDSLQGERKILIGALEQRSSNFYFNRLSYTDRAEHLIIDTASVLNPDSLFNKLDISHKPMVIEYALRQARDNKQAIDDQMRFIEQEDFKIRKHLMEVHRKFTLPFACLIFFFIGAPLGAIIRKGGLGMPVVISVLFFIIYYVIDTMGVKFAKEGVWLVYQGMWLSSGVLLPVGIFLTYKSATDSALLNADAYIIFFRKIRTKFQFNKKIG
jgi:lipopolysaccharide export system permease protein